LGYTADQTDDIDQVLRQEAELEEAARVEEESLQSRLVAARDASERDKEQATASLPIDKARELTAKVEEIAEEISSCHLSDLLISGGQQEESEAKCKYTMVDPATVTPSIRQIKIEKNKELVSPSKLGNNPNTTDDFDPDGLQRELDSLKDLLSGQITLDTSIMSGLLSPDTDSLINGMKLVNDPLVDHGEEDSPADLKFLTYNNSMNHSILALAAESSGINLEDDLLSTPPRSFDMETSILS